MIFLTKRSFLLTWWIFQTEKKYESIILEAVLYKINFLLKLLKKPKNRFHFGIFGHLKEIVLFVFTFSIQLPSKANTYLSTVSSSSLDTQALQTLNQRQFGIPLIFPTNIVLIPLLILFIAQYKTKKLYLFNFEVLLLVFFILAQISAANGLYSQPPLVWLLKFGFSFVVYFIFSRLDLSPRQLRVIFYAFLCTIFFQFSLCLLQFIKGGLIGFPFEDIRTLFPQEEFYSFGGMTYFRTVGTLSAANNVSAYLGFLLPITLTFTLAKKSKLKPFWTIGAILCVIISFVTLSRWGLITNLFSLIVIGVVFKNTFILQFRKKVKWIGVFLLTFFVTIFFVNGPIINRFLQFSTEDKSFQARIDLISQAFYIIRKYPLLGIGGGNFPLYLTNYDFTQTHVSDRFIAPVHSFYLQMLTDVGIIGFIVFFSAIVFFILFFLRKFRSLPNTLRFPAIGLFIAFLSFFFGGLWTLRSFETRIGFFFCLLFGLLVNILSNTNKKLPVS